MRKAFRATWLVLNQSQSPAFQDLLSRLTEQLGPCSVYTGMPHEPVRGEVRVVQGARYDRRGRVRRVASWLRFMAGATWFAARAPAGTWILATTNPPFLAHMLAALHVVRGHRYALLVWDLYPDHVVKMGWTRADNGLVRAWTALNRFAFRRAGALIAIGDGMAEAMRAQMGEAGRNRKIAVIHNWADVEAIRPVPKAANAFAGELGETEKLTVMYAGNLGATHGTDVIAAIAARLADDGRIRFVVVGEGLGRNALEREVAARGVSNVTFVDYQPWERLPLVAAAADVALVCQARGTEHLSVPSKTYTAFAAGSAVLALTAASSDLAGLVEAHDAGLVRPIDDVEGIAGALRRLASDPERLARYRANARAAAEAHFSADAARRAFADVLGRMSADGSAA